ncbi:hypothetical protein BJ944DRAFT_265694 [Cunninghamella echinulata]|nr:hypothetical protein BJ944DRAFT_265694 [Cunninghamella echinulata]
MDTKKIEDFVTGKVLTDTATNNTIMPTQRDIDIVRYSWEKVVDRRLPDDEESVSPAQAFGLAFYDALFELDPQLRSLFGTNVFTQAKMLSGVLAFITRVPFIKQNNNNNSSNNSDNDNDNDKDEKSTTTYINSKKTNYTIREINAIKREQEEKEKENKNDTDSSPPLHQQKQEREVNSNNILKKNNHKHKKNNQSLTHSRSSSSSISSKLKNNNQQQQKYNKDDFDVDPDLLIRKLQDLGARHFYYNVKPEQFKLVGPAMDAALKKRLGDEYTKEVKDAWSITHAYCAHQMALGLRSQLQYEKKKSNSVRNSSNNNCSIQ